MISKQQAIELSEARKDYVVRYGTEYTGPLSEADADDLIRRLVKSPRMSIKKLRVVEDYET